MDVILRLRGDIEIHHMIQGLDVDPTSYDIRGRQHAKGTLAESFECLGSLCLAPISMHACRSDPCLFQLFMETVYAVLGPAEHNDIPDFIPAE
jgi:hypothetical protein